MVRAEPKLPHIVSTVRLETFFNELAHRLVGAFKSRGPSIIHPNRHGATLESRIAGCNCIDVESEVCDENAGYRGGEGSNLTCRQDDSATWTCNPTIADPAMPRIKGNL